MRVIARHPFALSLSKGCLFVEEMQGFDKLSPNGKGEPVL